MSPDQALNTARSQREARERREKMPILKRFPESPNDDYRAGSDGRIYSRTHCKAFGLKLYKDWYPLKSTITRKGYLRLTLTHNGIPKTKYVHCLICSAFHGPPKSKSLQVRHLNGNPRDNRPGNLRWGTQEENWLDRRAHGNSMEGEKHPLAKFTDAEASHIAWAVKNGLTNMRNAARVLGVTGTCIRLLCQRVPAEAVPKTRFSANVLKRLKEAAR